MEPSRVHVYGPPEDDAGRARELEPDERICLAPDFGQVVVFHMDVQRQGCCWICHDCGRSTCPV